MPSHPLAQTPACARPARVLALWPTRRLVAVLLHGLQRGVTATQLRKLLEADLATLGFAAADVDHIEVGRSARARWRCTRPSPSSRPRSLNATTTAGGVCSLRRLTNTTHVLVHC